MLCTIFQSLASTVAKTGRGCQLFWMLPLAQTPANFGPKSFFGKLVPNPSCVPNLNMLASTVAEIRRGSLIFGCSFIQAPFLPILVLNVVFGKHHPVPKWCKLVPNPSCVPNLNMLASTVAEIRRGSLIFGCSFIQAPPPPILVLNVVFGKQHPVPKWCKKFVAHVHV